MVDLATLQVEEIKRLLPTHGREVAAGGRLIAAFVSVGEVRVAPVYDFERDALLGPARPRSVLGGFQIAGRR